MTLEDGRNIATIIAAAIALVGIGPLFINLRVSSRNLRAKVYLDTLTLLEGEDGKLRTHRRVLEEQLKFAATAGTAFDVLGLSLDVKQELDELARSYDKIGLLVKHGVVPIDFLFDFYSRPIVVAWTNLWPLIDHVRRTRVPSQPGHMQKFQILAVGAALYRRDKYNESPLFLISADDEAKWKTWKKWKVTPWFTQATP